MDQLLDGFSPLAQTLPLGLTDSKGRTKRPPSARRQQAEADHRAQLARAYSYRLKDIRCDADLERLDREFQERLADGPDWTRQRKGSEFREVPRHGLTRDDLAALGYRFNSLARASSKARAKGKHRGLISRTCGEVFRAFLYLAARYERLFPSYARLMHLADCSRDSVARALQVLESLGFLTRHRRLRMGHGLLGRKSEQDTNAYELHPPRTAMGRMALELFRPKSESDNQTAIVPEYLSYLRAHPETWGGESAAQSGACGGPP